MLPRAPANVSTHGRGHFICLFYFFFSTLVFFPHENPAELRQNAAEPQAHLPRCGWMGGGGGTGAGVGGGSAESTASKNSCSLDAPCGNLWSNFIKVAADFLSEKQRSVKGKSLPHLPGPDGCLPSPPGPPRPPPPPWASERSCSGR